MKISFLFVTCLTYLGSADLNGTGLESLPACNSAPQAAPDFTLSASSESKSRRSTITGFNPLTTDSSILRYSISPAPVAGLTFETTTGILSGTPTQNLPGETYTITAFNTSESATATFVLTVNGISCDGTTFDCAVGDRGPGNGIVFYVHAAGTHSVEPE